MSNDIFTIKRKSYIEIGEVYFWKSYIEIGEVYFWTATINQWQKLLLQDEYKDVVVSSLEYLSNTGKIDVYAFVIIVTRQSLSPHRSRPCLPVSGYVHWQATLAMLSLG